MNRPRKAPNGTIRAEVLQLLRARAGCAYTPLELHRLLHRSRGAIARACTQLADAGAVVWTAHPNRYTANPVHSTRFTKEDM